MNEKKRIEVDLLALLKLAKDDKKTLTIWCIVFGIISIVYAFTIPRIYTSSVTLAPESSSGNNLTSGISSLASMVGVNLEMGGGYDAIYPEIYPDLMSSKDFQVSMFSTKVKSLNGEINTNYYDYLDTKQKVSWMLYPFNLMKSCASNLLKSGNDSVPTKKGEINPKRLTKKQYDIANDIGSNIKCTVDKKTKVITISATAQDPYISTILADSAKEKLQYYITQYRTNKARNDVKYMEKLFTDAKADYDKARQRYASYSDANQDLQLATFRMKQEDLENEMQLKYNIYTQVASQLQLSRTKLQERTPAFTVIQSATMPFKHSNKSKLTILLTALFLAVFIRMSYLAIKNYKQIIHLDID